MKTVWRRPRPYLIFIFNLITIYAEYVRNVASFTYSYENKPQFYHDVFLDDPGEVLLNDEETTQTQGVTQANVVGVDASNKIQITVLPTQTAGTELSSVRVGIVSGTYQLGNSSATFKPPLQMQIEYYEEGLAGKNIRVLTGFLEPAIGEFRREFIYHFSHIDVRTDRDQWLDSINLWQATDKRIRSMDIFFIPDPDSYNALVVIDEIELWTREIHTTLDNADFSKIDYAANNQFLSFDWIIRGDAPDDYLKRYERGTIKTVGDGIATEQYTFWTSCHTNASDASHVIRDYPVSLTQWVQTVPGQHYFVTVKASFDLRYPDERPRNIQVFIDDQIATLNGEYFKTFTVDEAYFNVEDTDDPRVNLERRWQTSQVIDFVAGIEGYTALTIAVRNGKCLNIESITWETPAPSTEWVVSNTSDYDWHPNIPSEEGAPCLFPFAALDPTGTQLLLHYECQGKPFFGGFGWCGTDALATRRGACRGVVHDQCRLLESNATDMGDQVQIVLDADISDPLNAGKGTKLMDLCFTTSSWDCVPPDFDTEGQHARIYAAQTTYLNLAFKVPKRYMHNGDDAAFSINFHPYTQNLSDIVDSRACVTTNKFQYPHQATPCSTEYDLHLKNADPGNYEEFYGNGDPYPVDYRVYWETDDWDSCFNLLYAKLSWDNFVNRGWAWSERVYDDAGGDSETLVMRFLAVVETWDRVFTVSDRADKFGVLTIDRVRPNLFEIPFMIRFPKRVSVSNEAKQWFVNNGITSTYGVVQTQILNINWNPGTGESFGHARVVLATNTLNPYGLKNYGSPNYNTNPVPTVEANTAAATVELCSHFGHNTVDTYWTGDGDWTCRPDLYEEPAGAVWRIGTALDENTHELSDRANGVVNPSEAHERTCFYNTNPDSDLCEQKWVMFITPTLCDVSGSYIVNFWAACTDLDAACSLDINLEGTPQHDPDCSAWTYDRDTQLYACTNGLSSGTIWDPQLSNSKVSFEFEIQAQSFCPDVITSLFFTGGMQLYEDSAYSSLDDDVTMIVNTKAYLKAKFTAMDASTNEVVDIIDAVRVYRIVVDVQMPAGMDPLQIDYNSYLFGGLVAEAPPPEMNLYNDRHWDITICNINETFGGWAKYYDDEQVVAQAVNGDVYCPSFETRQVSSLAECRQFASQQSGHNAFTFYFEQVGEYNCYSFQCNSIVTESTATSTVTYRKGDDWSVDNDCFQNLNTLGEKVFQVARNEGLEGAGEIMWELVLDERLVPVDIDETPSAVTISLYAEIFYQGSDFPQRRRLQISADSDSSQTLWTDVFARRDNVPTLEFAYDGTTPDINAGLTLIMAASQLPTPLTIEDWAYAFSLRLLRLVQIQGMLISFLSISVCTGSSCQMMLKDGVAFNPTKNADLTIANTAYLQINLDITLPFTSMADLFTKNMVDLPNSLTLVPSGDVQRQVKGQVLSMYVFNEHTTTSTTGLPNNESGVYGFGVLTLWLLIFCFV